MKLTRLKAIYFSVCCSNISQVFLVYFWMNSCCTCLLAILRSGMMWRRSNFFAMNPRGTWRVAMWWALYRSLVDVFVCFCTCQTKRRSYESALQIRGSVPLFWSQEAAAYNPKPPVRSSNDPKGAATWKQFQIVCCWTIHRILHPRTLSLSIEQSDIGTKWRRLGWSKERTREIIAGRRRRRRWWWWW